MPQYLSRAPGECANYAAAAFISDAADLVAPSVIYVGVTGDLCIVPANADDNTGVIFKNVPVGFHPVIARRVKATGTTASELIACW